MYDKCHIVMNVNRLARRRIIGKQSIQLLGYEHQNDSFWNRTESKWMLQPGAHGVLSVVRNSPEPIRESVKDHAVALKDGSLVQGERESCVPPCCFEPTAVVPRKWCTAICSSHTKEAQTWPHCLFLMCTRQLGMSDAQFRQPNGRVVAL